MSILLQFLGKKNALIFFALGFTFNSYATKDVLKSDSVKMKLVVQELDSILEALKSDNYFGNVKGDANRFIEKAKQFVKAYPNEEKGGYYLDVSALIAEQILNESLRAIEIYDFLISNYPDYKNIEKALYHKAVILDLDLREKQKAIEAYQFLIEKFPDTVFREDAENRIQNIDLSVDDIIEGN